MNSFLPPTLPESGLVEPEPLRAWQSVRARFAAALDNRRLLNAVLFLVLAGLVARTLLFSRETPRGRALSELYENSLSALNATKTSYSPALLAMPLGKGSGFQTTHIAQNPSTRRTTAPRAPAQTSGAKNGNARRENSARKTADAWQPGDTAIRQWRALVKTKPARAAEWRRLGITLALFHRAGALDAFAHVADTFPVPPAPSNARRPRASLHNALQGGASGADPFGHGKVAISPPQELAAWKAIYGPLPLTPAQVPALRNTVQQLRLGWFENIALAHLYEKAGLRAEAYRAAEAADASPRFVRALDVVQGCLLLFGFIGLLLWGAAALGRRLNRRSDPQGRSARSPRALNAQAAVFPTYAYYAPTRSNSAPIANPPSTIANPQSPIRNRQASINSGSPLLLAFLIYLIGHTGIGLLASLALRPFAAQLDEWTALALLRLEFAYEFTLYVPIFLLPLLVLRAHTERDVFTGRLIGLRELLGRLGCRTRGFLAEAGSGAWAYVLLMPGLMLAGGVSHLLFHRFHTPVNPAQFESMAARLPADKILVFVLAAVVAPIVEETMFRGLLYSALRSRYGVGAAAMLSAAVFSAVHPTLPGGFLPIWAIGVALALVYERRGSLVPGMILHGIHNGLITLMGFAIFAQ